MQDNSSGVKWELYNDSSEVLSKIEQGKYVFHVLNSQKIYKAAQVIELGEYADFEISVDTKWLDNASDDSDYPGYGIFWGSLNWEYQWLFLISADRNYFVGGRFDDDRFGNWKSSEYINYKGDNALRLRRRGEMIEFYINENLVYSAKFDSFFGNEIGFRVRGTQKIAFDNLEVEQAKAPRRRNRRER